MSDFGLLYANSLHVYCSGIPIFPACYTLLLDLFILVYLGPKQSDCIRSGLHQSHNQTIKEHKGLKQSSKKFMIYVGLILSHNDIQPMPFAIFH